MTDNDVKQPQPGDLVWCFDYPTDPPYHVGNACLYELLEYGEKESKLKRPDNGAEVWFRYIAPYQTRNAIK